MVRSLGQPRSSEVTRRQRVSRIRWAAQGPTGPLQLSLIKQRASFVFNLVWGMHILQTIYCCPNTKWSDILHILEEPFLWDPKDVTELFAYDRIIATVRSGDGAKPIRDWKNKKSGGKRRTVQDVGLSDGGVLILTLDREDY